MNIIGKDVGGIVMKKIYETPVVAIDSFVANDYVAVCYKLPCDWDAANKVENDVYHTYSPNPTEGTNEVNHGAGGCGTAEHQYISVENGHVTIRELSADQGWLTCTVTSAGGADAIKPGSHVEWTTSASGGRVWHHQGTAGATFPGHPNRS